MTKHDDVLRTTRATNHGFIEVTKKKGRKWYFVSDKGRNALSNFRKSIEGLAVIEVNT